MIEKDNILSNPANVIHLVGIGGVSMSALAEALCARGMAVRGSDMQNGVHTERLNSLGVKVLIGHRAENVDGAHVVIRTSAIHDDNPEIIRARELGLQVLDRAQAWGILMEEFDEVVCISGTHGKTTTTAMMTCIALEAGLDPEVMIGADMREISGVFRIASSGLFIAEACEYCNSFLSFFPTVALINNIEEDHLDFFSGIDVIKESFKNFAELTRGKGVTVLSGEDENIIDTFKNSSLDIMYYGIGDNFDCCAKNLI